jgi:O-methyltransferase
MFSRIYWIKKLKAWFVRLRLHTVFGPLSRAGLFLAYLSRFSRWVAQHRDVPYNDFYNRELDLEYRNRLGMYEFLLREVLRGEPFDYLEFGVASGTSLRWWIEHEKGAASRFYGFDVFTGLPEDFGILKRGTFAVEGGLLPIEDDRCTLVLGLFQTTLDRFLTVVGLDRRTVVHLDADLYSSTLYVLTTLATRLKAGDVLIFDEFGVPLHEFRAFEDFRAAFGIKYEVLAAVNNYFHVAVQLVSIRQVTGDGG